MNNNVLGLYKHNQDSYTKVKDAFDGGEKVVGIIHATGTGKSYNALQLAYDNPDKKIIYVTPYNSIIEHVKEIINNNPNVDLNKDFGHVRFMTYASLANMSDAELKELDVDLMILDEFHHIGAPVWGDAVYTIINSHEDLRIFGMSAYSVRDRGTQYERDMAEDNGNELFSDKIVSRYDLVDAMLDGVLPVPIYKSAYIDILNYVSRLEEKVSKSSNPNLSEHLKILGDIKRTIISSVDSKIKLLNNLKPNGKYIYFCPPMSLDKTNDIHTIMEDMRNFLRSQGYKDSDFEFYYTTGEEEKIGKRNRDAFYKDVDLNGDDTSGKLRIMFAINQYNEGVHAPNIDGVILGRGTKSDIVYYEQIGRALSVRGNTYQVISKLLELPLEEVQELCKKRNIRIDNLSKSDIVERFVAPTIIDLAGNVSFIKNLFDELQNRMRKRRNRALNTSRMINITNNSFDIEILGQNLIDILENIGKQYLPNTWEESYLLAQKYYLTYGNLNISRKFKTEDGKSFDEYGYPLGMWLVTQKKLYAQGALADEQIRKLENIKVVWKTTKSWNESFELAKEYKLKHGNLNISYNFKTIDGFTYNDNGYVLGTWLVNQRRRYRNGRLAKYQIRKLEGLGIVWNVLRTFEESYQIVLDYYNRHKTINLPNDFCLEDGYNLGRFIYTQKQLKKNGKLSEERISLFNKLGIDWTIKEVKKNPSWDEMFMLAKNYYNKYNNLEVPRTFITKDGITEDSDGYNLGRWVSRQRVSHKNGKLTQEQIKLMESIGMKWNVEATHKSWEEAYELASKFFVDNGHLNIRTDYVTEDGYNLGSWIYIQRKNCAKERLTEEQVLKLILIGMIWNVSDNYSRIKEIFKANKINYRKYIGLVKHLSVIEFEAKINFLIENGYDIVAKAHLHEIFNMSDINMKVKYGVSREELIRNYLGIEKRV